MALLLLGFSLLRYPGECAQAAREGLELCGGVLLPSLFPFFVLSSLSVDLGLMGGLGRVLEGLMRPLFRVVVPILIGFLYIYGIAEFVRGLA